MIIEALSTIGSLVDRRARTSLDAIGRSRFCRGAGQGPDFAQCSAAVGRATGMRDTDRPARPAALAGMQGKAVRAAGGRGGDDGRAVAADGGRDPRQDRRGLSRNQPHGDLRISYMRALAIAATGMNAQQTNLEVIANNIANINTTAFKRARAEFSDLLYQTERMQGVPNRGGENAVPEGAQLGLGVEPPRSATCTAGRAGADRQPLRPRAQRAGLVPGDGRRRRDALHPRRRLQHQRQRRARDRSTAYLVDPAITDAERHRPTSSSTSPGEVFARIGGQTDLQHLGQLKLATFANEAGLEPLGGNLYPRDRRLRRAGGGVPGDPGFATVQQGYLESSNVDPVKEITELISAQRAYEMNSKVIQAADEMAGAISKGIR